MPVVAETRKIRNALLHWHAEHGMRAPWRESGDPYQALVAAVMAQQTQMSRVMPCYERFVAAFPTLDSLAEASLGDVIRVWAGMGYNTRAVRLHRAARTIARDGWPRDAADLVRIDGIGPFTAAIIASFSFGRSAACVDTNVRRVLGRIAGDEAMPASELQRLADEMIATEAPARWNQAVMDYGARVCTSRPKCSECVVARWCASRERFVAAPVTKVAEKRARYRVDAVETPFEESARYRRGRIIDALRATSPGEMLSMPALARAATNGGAPVSVAEARELVRGLERDGLVETRAGRVGLPDARS
jgi:A/G-specific adenine glycosylase